jgi:phage gpG-like protein
METFTSNAPQLAARLNAAASRIGEPRPALERVRVLLAQGEAQVFGSQGTAIGQHWPPPADPERKIDSRLLVATGALRNSLTNPGAGEVTELELRFGTDVPYGRFHQYGTSRMPARPFLGAPPDSARRVSELLAQQLEAAT